MIIIEAKRLSWMDILKGLAIITVVMGHCGAIGIQVIVLFHMPLFFFISGYFYKEKYSESPLNLLKKRLKSLYLPFIKYEILFLILHNLFYKINFYNTQINIEQSIYTMSTTIKNIAHILLFDGTELLLSPFWYLTALFIVTMLFCLISYLTKCIKLKEPIRGLIIIVIFIIGNYLTKRGVNLKISPFGQEIFNVSFVALIFFYSGFIYRKIETKIPMNIGISIIALIILYISAKHNLGIDMRTNHYPSIIMLLVNSGLGIYVMIYLSKKIDKMSFKFAILKYIGRNTIIIMALHITCFKLIGLLQIIIYKLPITQLANFGITVNMRFWFILYVVSGVLVPIAIQYFVIDKVKNIHYRITKSNKVTST